MAKTDKSSQVQNGNSGKDAAKQPASDPVVLSSPVEPGAAPVSRIPPSQPIESSMLGKSDRKIEPAVAKPTAAPAEAAKPAVKEAVKEEPAKLVEPAKPAAKAESAKPASAPPPAAKHSQVTVKKAGFWPMLFGGVIAAGLGAGAAIYAIPYLPASLRGASAPDAEALKAQIAEAAQAQVGALQEQVIAAASQAGSQAGANAAQTVLSQAPQASGAADPELAALQSRLEALSAEVAAMAKVPALDLPAGDGAAAPADVSAQIEALHQQVVAQSRALAALNERPQIDPQMVSQLQSLAANADQVRAEIAQAAQQAEASLANVQSQADAATKRAQAVASVAAINTALERGGEPTAAVQQLQQAGVEVPEQLSQAELPTLVEIQTSFDGASRAALRASLKAQSQGGGAMNAIGNFLRVQTGARSVEPREGGDPDAILSRATVQVQQGNLSAALTELDALPPAGKEALAAWTAQASAYLAAQAALNDVAQTLN